MFENRISGSNYELGVNQGKPLKGVFTPPTTIIEMLIISLVRTLIVYLCFKLRQYCIAAGHVSGNYSLS